MLSPQNNKINILKTLIYSDIFNYPLNLEEIHHFLISDKKIEKKNIKRDLQSLKKIIVEENEFYCFLNKKEIIKKRIKREKISQGKIIFAKKIASYLSLIPTICLIGISGALAMKNSDKKDDIDFFIIAKKNTLWISRLFLLLSLQFLGVLRKKNDQNLKNKICLNMLIDEVNLALPEIKKDLYNAHEVMQMLPLFERGSTYFKFIKANLWVSKFLANSIDIKYEEKKSPDTLISQCFSILLSVFELPAKKIQLLYMSKHKTREIISDHLLAFHPLDFKDMILSLYKNRVKKYAKI